MELFGPRDPATHGGVGLGEGDGAGHAQLPRGLLQRQREIKSHAGTGQRAGGRGGSPWPSDARVGLGARFAGRMPSSSRVEGPKAGLFRRLRWGGRGGGGVESCCVAWSRFLTHWFALSP